MVGLKTIKQLKKEIKEYHQEDLNSATCEVPTDAGICGEKVIPEVTFSGSSSSPDFVHITSRRIHFYWGCEKHGAVPALLNGVITDSPEEYFEELDNFKEEKLSQTKEIVKMIEGLKKKEKVCMEKDEYDEQVLEHTNQIEMADKILSKLKGEERK